MNVRELSVRVLLSGILVAATVTTILQPKMVSAAQITSRSLTLQSGTGDANSDGIIDGGAKAGGLVNHLFQFTLPSSTSLGSIKFEYCTIASVDACVTPTGLVTTTASLGSEAGATGFSIVNTANGAPYLTRTASAVTPGAVSYRLNSITNPTTENKTFFVRISTYTSTNATTGLIDTGSVAASTSRDIILSGVMPESLIFCTGGDISVNGGGIPDCTTATSGAIQFNQLFSPTDTATAKSQLAASTNAGSGYVITVNGPTLTSGVNTIPAMSTAATGSKGVGQFGMNLKLNTTATSTTPVGAEIAPTSNAGLSLRGQALGDYSTVDTFKFGSGESVANSAFGGSGGPTNAQIYTASYIVNVSGSQPAGTYSTTLTYICTASF
ncbi:MAG: exported protein of unknown function [Candidatus Saccharibacteria bacterium]|nr:exported protein of unknown function [Candidatus Saccharibacteria bacterium]